MAVSITLLSNYYQTRLWLYLYVEKNKYYRKLILEKNYKNVLDVWTWKLLTRLESWTHAEVDIFAKFTKIITDVIFRWTIIIWILSYYIPELLYIIIIAIILLSVSVYFLRKYIKKYNKLEQKVWEEDGRSKVKIIMEQLTIKLYGRKDFELRKSSGHLKKAAGYWIKVDVANEAFYKLIELIVRVLEIFIYLIVWWIIIKTWEYSVSYLVMLTWYIRLLREPLENAIININSINRVWEKYIKLKNFINLPDEIKNWKENYKCKKWKIELKNITFSYWKWKEILRILI